MTITQYILIAIALVLLTNNCPADNKPLTFYVQGDRYALPAEQWHDGYLDRNLARTDKYAYVKFKPPNFPDAKHRMHMRVLNNGFHGERGIPCSFTFQNPRLIEVRTYVRL